MIKMGATGIEEAIEFLDELPTKNEEKFSLFTDRMVDVIMLATPVKTGMMRASWIKTEPLALYHVILNTSEHAQYPWFGTHSPIFPRAGQFLAFDIGGKRVLARSVRGQPAQKDRMFNDVYMGAIHMMEIVMNT